MLCYQYSRGVVDIIHDTFAWLRVNRRIFRVAAIPLGVICVIAPFFVKYGLLIVSADDPFSFIGENLWPLLKPFALYDEGSIKGISSTSSTVIYALLTFLTTLLMTPLIGRYFSRMMSLKGATLKTAVEGIDWISIACAAIMTIMAMGWIKADNALMVFLMIACSWVVMSVVPCLIMRQRVKVLFKPLGPMAINLVLSALFFCIVQAIPAFCLTVVGMGAYFLEMLLPKMNIFITMAQVYKALDFVTPILMCASYCVAVTAYLVNTVIIHGSNYYLDR